MNRTAFLTLAHQAPLSGTDVPAYLATLKSSGLEAGHLTAFSGIVNALAIRFPAKDWEVWLEPEAAAILTAADEMLDTWKNSREWNDVYLARWAVLGSRADLAELVRRVLNRDGSSEADQIGTDAIGLLVEAEAADSLLADEMRACNVSFARIKFGVYPPGSVTLPLAGSPVPPRYRGKQAAELAMVPVATVAMPVPVPPAILGQGMPQNIRLVSPADGADRSSGKVFMGGVAMTISTALKLADSLSRAVLDLIRPAEGFTWIDDTNDPQSGSVLIELDLKRGEGLGAGHGGLLQAQVAQFPSRGPDPNAGKYSGRVYNKTGGFDEFETGADDIHAAKAAVAERVRLLLPT